MRTKLIRICIFISSTTLLFIPYLAHAETHINGGSFSGTTVWSAAGSPYIIEDGVTVANGGSLIIGEGTTIEGTPQMRGYNALYITGSLYINGTAEKPVTINGYGSISIDHATATISHADISISDGSYAYNSSLSIAGSTITDAPNGLYVRSSQVSITDSRFSRNTYGLVVDQPLQQVFQVRDSGPLLSLADSSVFSRRILAQATLANGFLAQSIGSSPTSDVHIMNSSLVDNTVAAIKNTDPNTVQATNDWWGSMTGPLAMDNDPSYQSSYNSDTAGILNAAVGSVNYIPWLVSDPLVTSTVASSTTCCSSVLFIPGIQASRLYRPESILGISMTNRLWEPNRNADAEKLFLNADGSNPDPSIYSGEPIDKAFGLEDVYGKFMSFLNGLVSKGKVNEWKSFGYDWRKPITEVVAGNEKKATTTENLIQTVEDLASRSKTGKVTLIAHSNGGLVAKYLVKTLADMGKAELIDSVISVAVPYIGTPQAIASILHGDGEDILDGLILSKANARTLGKNIPSAYSLLPSAAYFSKVFGPTIVFASTTIAGLNNGAYPQSIDSSSGQSAFITDTANARKVPANSDVTSPIKGNQLLINAANILHGILDPYYWPAAITEYAILGWGNRTIRSVVYSSKNKCVTGPTGKNCRDVSAYAATSTIMGDGTVVAPSAAYEDGTVASADLNALSDQEHADVNHMNILEASSTQTAIAGMIEHRPKDGPFPLPQGMHWGEPDYTKEPTMLILSTHSPVELHVYDAMGDHTGVTPMPAQLVGQVDEGLYTFTEKKIIGSSLDLMGDDNDPETYVYLPDDGQKYTVVIKGTGVGTFDYRVERVRGSLLHDNTTLGTAEYDNIPVTPLTVATTTLQIAPVDYDATTTTNFASTTQPIMVDVDGDGTADFAATSTASHSDTFDSIRYIESMKKTLVTLIGSSSLKAKLLLGRLDRLENLVRNNKIKQTHNFADRLSKRLVHAKVKSMTNDERQQILDMMDIFISQYE